MAKKKYAIKGTTDILTVSNRDYTHAEAGE